MKPLNCYKCIYYKVSWDKNFPHVCQIFDIKSRMLPYISVFQNTSRSCPAFKKRENLKNEEIKNNSNSNIDIKI